MTFTRYEAASSCLTATWVSTGDEPPVANVIQQPPRRDNPAAVARFVAVYANYHEALRSAWEAH
ncbi:MAG: hypothetical protein P4L90_09370 [Rhodopila sp.]|nr:hypothetical protein [Rhodopila sp.]